jgi:hypothetical protein
MPRTTPVIASLFNGVDLGRPTGPDPALRIARSYLRLELPGIMARYLLSATYETLYETVPGLFGRRAQPLPALLLRKAEDLSDAAYRLWRGRSACNVAGFYNATHLATLCAATVMTMGSDDGGRLDRLQFSTAQRTRLQRLRQNADELAAHYLIPSFKLPARFWTKDILDWVRAIATAQGKALADVAERFCLHPGLTSLLADADCAALNRSDVQARYTQNVAGLPGLSIEDVLRREAPALRVNLHQSLLP